MERRTRAPQAALLPATLVLGATCLGLSLGFIGFPLLIALLAAVVVARSVADWREGVRLLLLYLPFSGAVVLAMHPDRSALLYKDLVFVIPMYLGFGLAWTLDPRNRTPQPQRILLWMLAFAALVVLQSFGPRQGGWVMTLIGIKVWLFYMPLLLVGNSYVRDLADVLSIFRLMAVIAVVPCSIGIVQAVLARTGDYVELMEWFYGSAAAAATQQFTLLDYETGVLVRLPSTFTFVTQYFGFCLSALVPAYVLVRCERSMGWRILGRVALVLAIVAGLTSGARSAFIFIPLFMGLMLWFDRGWRSALSGSLVITGVVAASAVLLGLTSAFGGELLRLVGHYGDSIVVGGMAEAVREAPWGEGTGSSTGAARHALGDPSSLVAIENYYAKAVMELGIVGLLCLVGLFGTIVWIGIAARRAAGRTPLRSVNAALLGFLIGVIMTTVKGWMLDLDPLNVYFWLYSGMLVATHRLVMHDRQSIRNLRGVDVAPSDAIPAGLSSH